VIKTTVLIVGGGPAGAACAWRLKQDNIDYLILEKSTFPRMKPCAGWISPRVLSDIQLDPTTYPFSFSSFSNFKVSIRGVQFSIPTRQYAIRRIEFDDWLLQKTGGPLEIHPVKRLISSQGGYEVDDRYFGQYIVGAGGTYCPVFRTFFKYSFPKDRGKLIIAMEEEFPFEYSDFNCRLWFLENGFPGYSWYVPKKDGFLNVGIGGNAEILRQKGDRLETHWQAFVEKMHHLGLVTNHQFRPASHTYFLHHKRIVARIHNALLTGDAAGLATLDMGEGISPAIQSGILAAEAIIKGSIYSLDSISKYSIGSIIGSNFQRN